MWGIISKTVSLGRQEIENKDKHQKKIPFSTIVKASRTAALSVFISAQIKRMDKSKERSEMERRQERA